MDLSVFGKIFGIATGQTLQLARKEMYAKGCFDVQNNDFGVKLSLFSPVIFFFIRNGFGYCRYKGSVSFCLNNYEINSKSTD